MRKARLIPLLILLMLCLCAGASASSAASGGPGGQVYIASVYDAYGKVTTLTDGDTSTTWTRSAAAYSPDLTINLYSATVGEIWLRSGHCYTQTYYNHFDRPSVVAVTLWYNADRYTSASVTYRYRLTDAYRPYTMSSEWNSGYQRLLDRLGQPPGRTGALQPARAHAGGVGIIPGLSRRGEPRGIDARGRQRALLAGRGACSQRPQADSGRYSVLGFLSFCKTFITFPM